MKYVPLVFAGLWRKPLRTVLTVLAILVAFVLFGVMHGVIAAFDSALESMSDMRLRTMSRANILEALPLAHAARIARVPGVREVSHVSIMIGYYQDPKNNVVAAATDLEGFLSVFPEISIPEDQRDALLRSRTGAVVGAALARKFGWNIGDRVTLHSLMWPRDDGSVTWTFDIVAIANAGEQDDAPFGNELYFHYAYFDESRGTGRGTVHQYALTIDDAGAADAIAQAIDGQFANSSDETLTLNDRDYVTAQMRQVGNVRLFVNAILGAVLFTLLFLTGNTMMQSVRDRSAELGVLKSVGFTNTGVLALLWIEALVLCLAGAAMGLAIAALVFPPMFESFNLGPVPLLPSVWIAGIGVAALLATMVTLVPGWRAQRLTVAEALAGH